MAPVQLSGTVIRTGLVRVVERVKFFRCASDKCGFEFPVHIEVCLGRGFR